MKRRLLATAARSGLSTIFLVYSVIAHCGEDAFAKWAAAHAHPVTTVESAGNDSDLLPFKSAIGAARVVALGEPIHGAHETLAFRNRLFRFLVEQMGFTAIALETGFTESNTVSSFTNGDEGAAGSAVIDDVLGNVENRELLRWMRDYNAAASSAGHRKIRFYGVDLTDNARKSGPRRAMEYALNYLSLADPANAKKIRISLGDRLPSSDEREFGPVPTTALAGFDTSISAIAKAMETNRDHLIARSSDEAYRRALRNLDVARQVARCLPLTPPPSVDNSVWGSVHACRDAAMAENVQWILENEGREGRLFVFAHNGHVINNIWDGGRRSPFIEQAPVMGFHLRRAYGDDLYIIAMSSVATSGDLPLAKRVEDSLDDELAGVGLPKMFLDLRMARQDPAVLAWLSQKRPLGANMGHYDPITPSTALDAFVFLRELTPEVFPPDQAP